MSVLEENEIDLIGLRENTDDILVLAIDDPLEWEVPEGEKIDGAHLLILQDKLNMYAHYIETEQYHTVYPSMTFESFEIEILFAEEIPEYCYKFLEIAERELEDLNISIIATYAPD